MRCQRKALLIIAGISLACDMACASTMSNDYRSSSEVIFILNGPKNPADVRLGVKKNLGQKFMRLPDLGAMSLNLGGKKVFKGSASSTIHRGTSQHATIETAQENAVQKQSFKFKPTKVSGRPKLPSIQFSSLSPELELYEVAPSLDFTDKSLKDGGF